jgi:hypothetical protein
LGPSHVYHTYFAQAVVRIGPNEVHFNSITALRTIYGAGSGFERNGFYSMFDVYGRKNLFTFFSVTDHAKRKRVLAHAYLKSAILKSHPATIIEDKIKDFLQLLAKPDASNRMENFSTLHYYLSMLLLPFCMVPQTWAPQRLYEARQNI